MDKVSNFGKKLKIEVSRFFVSFQNFDKIYHGQMSFSNFGKELKTEVSRFFVQFEISTR